MTAQRFANPRDAARAHFLQNAGWAGAPLAWRPGDASFRRYAHIQDNERRAILMDAPPEREPLGPFLQVGSLLTTAGLSTPETLAVDAEQGFLLLEDFGDATFTKLLDTGADAAPLYELATDVLIRIREQDAALTADLPPYDPEARTGHLSTFLDYLWPEAMGCEPTPEERATFNALWLNALKAAPTLGQGFVHRDFHVDNLMRLEGRSGVAACGVLDFQDAAYGPFAYDLASLLEDARRDVPASVRTACLARYQAAVPTLQANEIAAALAVHGGQRHCRVAGLWIRLWRRDGKPGYLKHMRRTLDHLEHSLRHPALADIAAFLDKKFPATARSAIARLHEAPPQ